MSFSFYKSILRPLLFLADPEAVHHLAIDLLTASGPLLRLLAPPADPRLERTVFGVRFPNPVGLAAGFDKDAVAIQAWEGLGFGFAEIGTITALAQPGNPKPRLFRVPEVAGDHQSPRLQQRWRRSRFQPPAAPARQRPLAAHSDRDQSR